MRDRRVIENLARLAGPKVETTEPWTAGDPDEVGVLVILEGADRIAVAATWYPHIAPGGFVIIEDPIVDEQKIRVVEQRLGRASLEGGYAVYRP